MGGGGGGGAGTAPPIILGNIKNTQMFAQSMSDLVKSASGNSKTHAF